MGGWAEETGKRTTVRKYLAFSSAREMKGTTNKAVPPPTAWIKDRSISNSATRVFPPLVGAL